LSWGDKMDKMNKTDDIIQRPLKPQRAIGEPRRDPSDGQKTRTGMESTIEVLFKRKWSNIALAHDTHPHEAGRERG